MTSQNFDDIIFADDLRQILGFADLDSVRKHIKMGTVPPADGMLKKSRFWHRQTLARFEPLVFVRKPEKTKSERPVTDQQIAVWQHDADSRGLLWMRKTSPKSCMYQFLACGHQQDIGYKDVRSGSFKCRTCLTESYAKQAQSVGLTLIKQTKARVGLFKFNECGHVREIDHKSVRLNTFVCQECEGSWATRPSNLYVNLISLQGEQLVKVGHAKDVQRRVKEYGLPSDAKLETVFVRNFPTGKDASTAETAILQKFKASRVNEISHIMQKSGRTECLQPSVLHDVLVFAQSIPNQYFQESLP